MAQPRPQEIKIGPWSNPRKKGFTQYIGQGPFLNDKILPFNLHVFKLVSPLGVELDPECPEWARTYVLENAMIASISVQIGAFLREK